MKLLMCLHCNDIVKFHYIGNEHWCSCKRCYGILEDHIRIRVFGPCVVLGISNLSLKYALSVNDIDPREGVAINAFIISDDAESIIRETHSDQLDMFYARIESEEVSSKTKKCRECGNDFPATTDHFYQRTRNGPLENICKRCRIASQPYRLRIRTPKEKAE